MLKHYRTCLLCCLLLYSASAHTTDRQLLSVDWLNKPQITTSPVQSTAFAPLNKSSLQPTRFSGQITLEAVADKPYFKTITDRYQVVKKNTFQITKLPFIQLDIIQRGDTIIPSIGTVVTSKHPYWEWLIMPGKIWQEPGDDGYTRVALPFALQEKNANCTHNGLILLLLKADGGSSTGFVQITSETCAYLQFDFASRINVDFQPKPIAGENELIQVFLNHQNSKTIILTTAALKLAYPLLDVDKLQPPDTRGSTVSGVLINGRHYRLHCQTRFGSDPYCDNLALPSYSTAKSIFAGLALMRLEKLYPGIGQTPVTEIVPECAGKSWQGVTLSHLLNMRTGHYSSRETDMDETSKKMIGFFLAETHREKLELACNMFPRRGKPGGPFVYHTSDTYLAGIMLNKLYQKLEKRADIYTDWFADDLWPSLHLSPLLADSKRSYDDIGQALTGFGLTYTVDDILKISRFLFSQVGAADSILDQKLLSSALQTGSHRINRLTDDPYLAYNNGFWALEVSKTLGCKNPKWIPFMSGYGGITVALISPDLLYYNYADDNQYRWLGVVKELQRQFNLCED
ncbi:MAG: serine hydrolase [Proteobacteria bacterium]|nr:serine hydrolase [Pseudomonadota bacterium]